MKELHRLKYNKLSRQFLPKTPIKKVFLLVLSLTLQTALSIITVKMAVLASKALHQVKNLEHPQAQSKLERLDQKVLKRRTKEMSNDCTFKLIIDILNYCTFIQN